MIPLSAVIIAKDEEKRLPDALASVSFCDEVVVVDGGSTDRTREIAEASGARVSVNVPWPGWVIQRNKAVEEASHDWILAVDADERISDPLRDEIQELRRGPLAELAGCRIPRVALYLGRWIRATDWYPDPQIRLFDRRRGRWHGRLVHESVRVEGPVRTLRGDMIHLPYADLEDHLRKINLYTTLWAQEALERGRRFSLLDLVVSPWWAFWRNWLVRRGFTLGRAGFAVAALNSYYTFVKLAKLGELERLSRSRHRST